MFNTLGVNLHVPVRALADVPEKTLVSDLDTSVVHLDLKGLSGAVISNSLLLYGACFQPLSTVWALDDNSVSQLKLINGRSPLLFREIQLVFISLLDHLLVINVGFHAPWQKAFGSSLEEPFCSTPTT